MLTYEKIQFLVKIVITGLLLKMSKMKKLN